MPAALGTLSVVATPIGNYQDITLRALEVLKAADCIICEELREGSTLLKKLNLPPKPLITLNEHNEKQQIADIAVRLAQGQQLALVSDCGTPVFADPGAALIREISEMGFPVTPIPGPSSLMAAFSVLDFKLERYFFAGFLPRDPQARQAELLRLRALHVPVVLMDTPYRLDRLLDEVARAFGKGHPLTLACDLTLPTEQIFRGPAAEVRQAVNGRKAEFILILHEPSSPGPRSPQRGRPPR